MLLEERGGTSQHGVIDVIAQIRDHAEATVIHQVGAGVIADSLQDRGNYESEGDDGPVVVQLVRHERLEMEDAVRARDTEELNFLVRNGRIENPLEDWAD